MTSLIDLPFQRIQCPFLTSAGNRYTAQYSDKAIKCKKLILKHFKDLCIIYIYIPLLSSDTQEEGIGSQRMVVSHHVVAGIVTQEQSVLLLTEPSHQPSFFLLKIYLLL